MVKPGDDERSDEALMRAWRDGDAPAFDRLYARHRTWLYNLLVRQVQDRTRADDIFQETWYSLIRSAATWEPKARFTTWLYMLARQRLVDHWRRANPEDESLTFNEEDEAPPALLAALTDSGSDPAVLAERGQLAQRLLAAVTALPAAQREVFLLVEQSDMTLEDIAGVTGSTRETVKSRLRYARAKLAQALADGWR